MGVYIGNTRDPHHTSEYSHEIVSRLRVAVVNVRYLRAFSWTVQVILVRGSVIGESHGLEIEAVQDVGNGFLDRCGLGMARDVIPVGFENTESI